ncbi:MAG: hypothetical protein JNL74_09630 [Fibrobacteres bacterium]|nr:hypothetical protein [Fibrobacterota bacterium]
MKYMKLFISITILSLAFGGEYLAVHRNNTVEYLKLSLIDSLTFPDSNTIQRGTILKSKPLLHRIDEFNTLGLQGSSTDENNFGAYGGNTSAFAATPLNFSDIATDEAVLASTPLTELYDSTGSSLNILVGDTLSVTATINDGVSDETITAKYIVIDNPLIAGRHGPSTIMYRVANIQQFLLAMEDFISGIVWRGGAGSNAQIYTAVMPTGRICIQSDVGTSQPLKNLFISSSNAVSKSKVSMAFKFPSLITVGSLAMGEMLLRPAKKNDYFFNPLLYDAMGYGLSPSVSQIFSSNGLPLDVIVGDTITVAGTVGSVAYGPSPLILSEVTDNVNTSTTLQNLTDCIKNALNLPAYDNSIANNPSVSIVTIGSSVVNQAGSIMVRGQPSADLALKNVIIKSRPKDMASRGVVFDAGFVLTEQ